MSVEGPSPKQVELARQVLAEKPVEPALPKLPKTGKEINDTHQQHHKPKRQCISSRGSKRISNTAICAFPRSYGCVQGEKVPARTDGQDHCEPQQMMIVINLSVELRNPEGIEAEYCAGQCCGAREDSNESGGAE